MPKRVKTSVILSIIFFLLVKLHPVWARLLPIWGILIVQLIGLFMLLALCLFALIGIFKLFFNKNYSKPIYYLPIILLPLVVFEAIKNPFKINLDNLYGNIEYKARREGTQNYATFELRENNKFEIHWTGWFGSEKYFRGVYRQVNDTLFLDFNKGVSPRNFGNKVLLSKGKGLVWLDSLDRPIRTSAFHEISKK